MLQILILACALLAAAMAAESGSNPAEGQQTGRSRVSDEQLNMALSDKRYLNRQLKCALGEAPCDPVGRRLKSTKKPISRKNHTSVVIPKRLGISISLFITSRPREKDDRLLQCLKKRSQRNTSFQYFQNKFNVSEYCAGKVYGVTSM